MSVPCYIQSFDFLTVSYRDTFEIATSMFYQYLAMCLRFLKSIGWWRWWGVFLKRSSVSFQRGYQSTDIVLIHILSFLVFIESHSIPWPTHPPMGGQQSKRSRRLPRHAVSFHNAFIVHILMCTYRFVYYVCAWHDLVHVHVRNFEHIHIYMPFHTLLQICLYRLIVLVRWHIAKFFFKI